MQAGRGSGNASDESAFDVAFLVNLVTKIHLIVFDSVRTALVLMRYLLWRILNNLSLSYCFFFEVLAFFAHISGNDCRVLDDSFFDTKTIRIQLALEFVPDFF